MKFMISFVCVQVLPNSSSNVNNLKRYVVLLYGVSR